MYNENIYVIQSLKLNLFFARIMKEHSFFISMGFVSKNSEDAKTANDFKIKFERLLNNYVKLSDGLISRDVLESKELCTEFTLDCEKQSEKLTGIRLNQDITIAEKNLKHDTLKIIDSKLIENVKKLNKHTITLIDDLTKFKEDLLKEILDGNILSFNYPLLFTHMIREGKLYQSYLYDIENGIDLDNEDIKKIELFWDLQLMEHALFIKGLLDPNSEMESLIDIADSFADNFKKLLEETKKSTDMTMKDITSDTLDEAIKLSEFKKVGTQGLLSGNIQTIAVPLLVDHILRENLRYIRILKSNK